MPHLASKMQAKMSTHSKILETLNFFTDFQGAIRALLRQCPDPEYLAPDI